MSHKRDRFPFESTGFDRLAQTWIQDCCQNHVNCGPARDHQLPTRVICVGQDNQDPYLVVTDGTMVGKWISLSYCWGTVQTLETTTESLEEHKKSIPLAKLPRTIRDAVAITRSLGIAYLWVDALCIIQGSEADWTRESSKMSDVYRNAVATIAASSANNVQGSCFLDRNRLATRPCRISFLSRSGALTSRWIHGARGVSWRDRIRNSPLQQRGWTLQEAHLSIRILHYTDSELLWQCREGVRRELAVCDLLTANDPMVDRRMFDAFSFLPRNVFARWYHLVEEYSGRGLTVETDKLPAISGMAAEMGRFLEARRRRRLATDEERWTMQAQPLDSVHDPSAWFMLHLQEIAHGRPILGLEDHPLASVSPRLLNLYMGSDFDPYPGKATVHSAVCDECGERIRGMRYKCLVCPDFDYCDGCIAKADALHPLHSFRPIDRLEPAEPDKGSTTLGPTADKSEPGGIMPLVGDDNDDGSGAGDDGHGDGGSDDRLSAELYIYAKEDGFPPIVEWPDAVTGSRYLAGMWEADLHAGLMWRVNHAVRRTPGEYAAKYRAPSWSWASVNSPVCYEHNKLTYIMPEGLIKARAQVVKCEVTHSRGELIFVAPITELPLYTDEDGKLIRKQHITGSIVAEELLHLDHEPPRLPLAAQCIRIDWCSCLVLEPTGDVVAGRAIYRRIGAWIHDNIAAIQFDNMTGCKWETKTVIII